MEPRTTGLRSLSDPVEGINCSEIRRARGPDDGDRPAPPLVEVTERTIEGREVHCPCGIGWHNLNGTSTETELRRGTLHGEVGLIGRENPPRGCFGREPRGPHVDPNCRSGSSAGQGDPEHVAGRAP